MHRMGAEELKWTLSPWKLWLLKGEYKEEFPLVTLITSCVHSSVMWEEQTSCLACHKTRTHFRMCQFLQKQQAGLKKIKLRNSVQPALKKRLIITGQSTQFLILKIPYLQWGHWALCSVSQRCDGKRKNLFKQTGMKELQANRFYH